MATSSSITFTATGGPSAITGVTASATGNEATVVSVTVPASTTHQLYSLAMPTADLKSVFLYTDGALTVKTNSTSAPDQTLTFAADYPLAWASGMPNTNPITTAVTQVYLTNASTTAAVVLAGIVNATN